MDLVIDFYSKTPAYQQLADKLRAAIDSGELRPMQEIPSTRALAAETGLAMTTVSKGVKVLERENRLFTVRGRGTYVSGTKLGRDGFHGQ